MPERMGLDPRRSWRVGLRLAALGWLALLLGLPLALLVNRTLQPGLHHLWRSLTTPAAQSAFRLTVEVAAAAVPLDLALGLVVALVLARRQGWIVGLLDAVVDLPFAISPVVVGLALFLLYGKAGWLSWLPVQVLFTPTAMVIATVFVCLPYIVREVVPVLRERGTSEEEAGATLGASTWQVLWRITMPAVKPALAYGIVLSVARAIGEFGAVSVVSGRIAGSTETLPLLVQRRYDNLDLSGAYAAAALLAVLAVAALIAMRQLHRQGRS